MLHASKKSSKNFKNMVEPRADVRSTETLFHVLPFDFMQWGEQTLRLTTLLTSTFQLMTSCDFGPLHFPIQCAMLIRWITPWLQQQKQGRISGTLALKGNQKQKKSEKTVEQSMAIRKSLRWYYRGDPDSKFSSPKSFPQTKAKLSIIVSKSECRILASKSPKMNSISQ